MPAILRAFPPLIGCRSMSSPTLSELEEALVRDPQNAELLKTIGNARKASGDWPGAVASYRASLALSPDYLPSLYNLGLILHELSQHGEAERCFRRVLELEPGDVDALFHLGALLHGRSAFGEAAQTYRLALQRSPSNRHLWLALAQTLMQQPGQQEESARCLLQARLCLTRAVELDPASSEARIALGNALQDEGRLDEAIGQYREAIRHS